ncbi:recombinase family protein [Catellatospora sp. NPDC049609]|uniref:recombinase family protein n=1 Tax=Catellatospora sp. NPDC049609 TaxID=3155505 RepID=UPI00341A0042
MAVQEPKTQDPILELVARLLAGQATRRPDQWVAFIYARCSSDPLGRGKSVERQVEDCWLDCERNGWHVGGIYVDNDRSASSFARKDREEYNRMVLDLRANPVNVLVCWEASRATRDVRTYLDLADLSREQDLRWYFNGTMYHLEDEDDEFRAMLDVSLNHREVRKLSRRVRAGLAKSARDGLPHGGPIPYGYVRRYDERTREFIAQDIDDKPRRAVSAEGVEIIYNPADIMREIFDRMASGDSLHMIMKSLNERGIPSPAGKTWTTQRVRGMCLNTTYIGWRTLKGAFVREGVWKGIVAETTFNTVAARLEDPSRKTNWRKGNKAVHLLSFIARCGKCGDKLRTGVRKDKRGRYYQYRCDGKGCVAIRCEKLDAYVETLLIARMSDPKTLEWLVRPDDTAARESAERAAALRGTIEQWKAKAKTGSIGPDEYDEIVSGLHAEVARLEAKAAPVYVPLPLRSLVSEDAAETWDGLLLAAKRDVLDVVMGIDLLPAKTVGGRGFDPDRVRVTWLLDGRKVAKQSTGKPSAAHGGGAKVPRQLARTS